MVDELALRHTRVSDANAVNYLRGRVAADMAAHGALSWRWHGIGLLQAYLEEGDGVEVRIHIWSRKLILPGIVESGIAHNHRFRLQSTVLAGELLHTEWNAIRDDEGEYETFDFVNARRHTEENRSDMRPTGERYSVEKLPVRIQEGSCYEFDRWAFHSSQPLSDVVVTLVQKHDQVEKKAQVIAPCGVPPVPAFSGDLSHEMAEAVILDAIKALGGSR